MPASIEFLRSISGPADECWPWLGVVDRDGYGRVGERGLAHRVSYEQHVGPIPSGLTVDHRCHSADAQCALGGQCPHRRCINPAHLELLSAEENSRRQQPAAKSHCRHGHLFDEANTYRCRKGRRHCRKCTARRQTEYKRRTRANRQEKAS